VRALPSSAPRHPPSDGVLRAYVGAGSIKLAAHRLGITESTARQHLAGLYRRTGCQNPVQAACLLGATDGRAA
jgi:DNA-binding NarL/FixJ family response regulator